MIILRNKFFSNKEKKDETKLKVWDRLDIWSNKHLENTERRRKYLKGEANPLSIGGAALVGAGTGSVLAIPAGGEGPFNALADKNYKKAAILSAGGAVIHPAINKAAGSFNKSKLRKNPHANDRSLDRLDVAEGKMSKEEFAKKWYKGESKKN